MKTLEDEVYEVVASSNQLLLDIEITKRVRATRIVAEDNFWKRLQLSLFSSLTTDDVAHALGTLQSKGKLQSKWREERWYWGIPYKSYGK